MEDSRRLDLLFHLLNATAKSGYVKPRPILEEIVRLCGLDPEKVVINLPK